MNQVKKVLKLLIFLKITDITFQSSGGGKSKADCYSAIAKNKARAKVHCGFDANSPKKFGIVLAHCTSLANVTVKVGSLINLQSSSLTRIFTSNKIQCLFVKFSS